MIDRVQKINTIGEFRLCSSPDWYKLNTLVKALFSGCSPLLPNRKKNPIPTVLHVVVAVPKCLMDRRSSLAIRNAFMDQGKVGQLGGHFAVPSELEDCYSLKGGQAIRCIPVARNVEHPDKDLF